MRLLMLSGDRQSSVGEVGPFHQMQAEFSRWFERIDVLCPRPDKPVTTLEIHGNVFLHPAPVGRGGMLRWLVREGRRLLSEHGHSLIVSHDYGWFYNGLAAAQLTRITQVPYLSEIHHVPGYPKAVDLRERFDYQVARCYIRWARSRAAAFRVVNAGEMRPLLLSFGVPSEKIRVLPSLYIDLKTFAPLEPAPKPLRDFLFVGRLVANKNVAAILEAMALCEQRGRSYTLTVVGRGPLQAKLKQQCERLGLTRRVEWIDWVRGPMELAELYRSSRAFCLASSCEGGPRVTVEAMASGTPVISTPVGVMGELLSDQKAGLLFPFDPHSLSEAMDNLLGDETARQSRGREARRRAEAYEYQRVLEGYARGLHELVGAEAVRR